MRLSARARASRENGRKSRGPTSVAGKTKSSRNAVRHGLATPILAYPGASKSIIDLANKLAGKDAGGEIMDLARRAAEAQLDLERIEAQKVRLLTAPWVRLLRSPVKEVIKSAEIRIDAILKLEEIAAKPKLGSKDYRILHEQKEILKTVPLVPSFYTREYDFGEVSGELAKIERYERRAFSRRTRALRALDQAKAALLAGVKTSSEGDLS